MKPIAIAAVSLVLVTGSPVLAQDLSAECAMLAASPFDPLTPAGQGINPEDMDVLAARVACKAAAKAPNASARDFYHYGRVQDVNWTYTSALKQYEAAAADEFGPALEAIGELYEFGHGVEVDTAKAFDYYQQAWYNTDIPLAAARLGNAYAYGIGTTIDYAEALPLFEAASQAGIGWASNEMGLLYEYGRGVDIDYARAAVAYKVAFKQGELVAANNLGTLYENGRGVDADLTQAVRWFKAAAEKGEGNGLVNLGRMYESGEGGLEQSGDTALGLYMEATAAGNPAGYRYAGYLHATGLLVPRDMELARILFQDAIDQGNEQLQASTYNVLAYSYAFEGDDFETGLDYIEHAIDYAPDYFPYIDTQAWLHFRNGDMDEALSGIERAMVLAPDVPDVHAHAGDIYLALDRESDARAAYEIAVANQPALNTDPTIDYDKIAEWLADNPADDDTLRNREVEVITITP